MTKRLALLCATAAASASFLLTAAAPAEAGTTKRVSVGTGGVQANLFSYLGSLSASGRSVVFFSPASNLVPGDGNGESDVFVHGIETGRTTRLSVATDGTQANGHNQHPVFAPDGRSVAFQSFASNLATGDTNRASDIFLHERATAGVARTTRVSLGRSGVHGNRDSFDPPALSFDGRYVGFSSDASNLVPGDTNGQSDVFVRDRRTGAVERVSTSSRGAQGNGFSGGVSISADGRYVAFSSDSSTLVAGDTNGTFDVFVHDRQTGTTTRVSVGPGGRQAERGGGSAAISADGRYVAYYSSDPGLVSGDTNGQEDVFVRDQRTGAVERVSKSSRGVQSNGFSYNPAISADGRYVAFGSDASNLVPGDTNGAHDIFVHDRRTKATTRVSVGPGGRQANGQSLSPVISADGGVVAFTSQATNLVPGDTNGEGDVFVHLR